MADTEAAAEVILEAEPAPPEELQAEEQMAQEQEETPQESGSAEGETTQQSETPAQEPEEKQDDASSQELLEHPLAAGGGEQAEEEKGREPPPPPRPRKAWTMDPAEGVDLLIGESGLEAVEPITVGKKFQEIVAQYPTDPALRYKEGGEWRAITYAEYYDLCIRAAKSFLKLGLEPLHSVAIIGFNSPEWLISNLGAMFAGGLACGIYATNNPEACHYVADHSKANIVVVENKKQLDKFLEIRDRLPHLKAIVQYKGKVEVEDPKIYEWEQFMKLGEDMDNSVIEEKIKAQRPEQCALLVYTSGTTGDPKGVMLSHDNLIWTASSLVTTYNFTTGNQAVVSYLPLSHIAAQMADIYIPICAAATVSFAQPDALKGTLLQTLQEVQPTFFFAVPRVWEKMKEGMQASAVNVTGLKRWIATWAKGKGLQGNRNIQNNQPVPWGWSIANMLVFSKVRERLGFQKCTHLITGAAPISKEVLEYFMSVNLPVLELYGESECSGPQSFNLMDAWRLGSVGKAMVGVQMKIDNPDENGEGEVLIRGRHVFMGYLNNAEKTRETVDDEGWLHTGDVGKIDEGGFLYITGRIKEIIITSGGENIAPVPVEDRIKKEVPFLSNVMVIGDKRKYLTCLITLKTAMDLDTGEPKDELLPQTKQALSSLGSECTLATQVVQQKDEAVYRAIQQGLDRANEEAFSRAQKVQKFTVLDKDFSEPGGELGPTLKLKRRSVMKKYGSVIDTMYDEETK